MSVIWIDRKCLSELPTKVFRINGVNMRVNICKIDYENRLRHNCQLISGFIPDPVSTRRVNMPGHVSSIAFHGHNLVSSGSFKNKRSDCDRK